MGAWILHCVEDRVHGVFNAVGLRGWLSFKEFLHGCKFATTTPCRFTWVDQDFLKEHDVWLWTHLPMWLTREGRTLIVKKAAMARGLSSGRRPIPSPIPYSGTRWSEARGPSGQDFRQRVKIRSWPPGMRRSSHRARSRRRSSLQSSRLGRRGIASVLWRYPRHGRELPVHTGGLSSRSQVERPLCAKKLYSSWARRRNERSRKRRARRTADRYWNYVRREVGSRHPRGRGGLHRGPAAGRCRMGRGSPRGQVHGGWQLF